MDYTFFIDESGDQGTDKVREGLSDGGASPFLSLAGVLVPNVHLMERRNELEHISNEIGGKAVHNTDLTHFQRAYVARRVGEMQICMFGVVSKKSTLGSYKDTLKERTDLKVASAYYNKCAQYLLERLGHFMREKDFRPSQVSIVFEEMKNHDYQSLQRYIRRVKLDPENKYKEALERIDPSAITAKSKSDEPLLALADVAAYALGQSVNRSKHNYGIAEQRYLRELKHKFWACPETGQIADFGIKYVMGPRWKMGLEGSELALAQKMFRKDQQKRPPEGGL